MILKGKWTQLTKRVGGGGKTNYVHDGHKNLRLRNTTVRQIGLNEESSRTIKPDRKKDNQQKGERLKEV